MSEAENFLKVSLEKVSTLIDSNKTVGHPIVCDDGRIIIPLSEVKLCYISGGAEYSVKKEEDFPFGGVSGGNLVLRPSGFVVISEDKVSTLGIREKSVLDSLVSDVISGLLKKK